jgi:hypothetical protein
VGASRSFGKKGIAKESRSQERRWQSSRRQEDDRRFKRIYRQAGPGKEALNCEADRDDDVRPEAREQKER